MKNLKCTKIQTRLLEADAVRFERVAKEKGFTSGYSLLRYLIYVFLRAADSRNDVITAPLPEELKEFFGIDRKFKKDLEAVYEKIRRVSFAHNIQKYNQQQTIEEEVAEMFEECEHVGRTKTYRPNVLKRTPK